MGDSSQILNGPQDHQSPEYETDFLEGSSRYSYQNYRYSCLVNPPSGPLSSNPDFLLPSATTRLSIPEAMILSCSVPFELPASGHQQAWQSTSFPEEPTADTDTQQEYLLQPGPERSVEPNQIWTTSNDQTTGLSAESFSVLESSLAPHPISGRYGTEPSRPRSREKKHACGMCHKSFDRPSTLRKHLLVHTGEKAYSCDTCGRRFGVASNLNRHRRRCILKPVNKSRNVTQTSQEEDPTSGDTAAQATSSSPGPSSGSSPQRESSSTFPMSNDRSGVGAISSGTQSRRTKNTTSANSNLNSIHPTNAPTTIPSTESDRVYAGTPDMPGRATLSQPTVPKRRRRAPSLEQWIPESLRGFNLNPEEAYIPAPIPLLPRFPNPIQTRWSEERNSWDQDVSDYPYRADGWKGRLPGPGLRVDGVPAGRGLTICGANGFVMGRVVL